MHSVGWIHKFLRATPSSRRSVLWSLKVLKQRSLFLQTVYFGSLEGVVYYVSL